MESSGIASCPLTERCLLYHSYPLSLATPWEMQSSQAHRSRSLTALRSAVGRSFAHTNSKSRAAAAYSNAARVTLQYLLLVLFCHCALSKAWMKADFTSRRHKYPGLHIHAARIYSDLYQRPACIHRPADDDCVCGHQYCFCRDRNSYHNPVGSDLHPGFHIPNHCVLHGHEYLAGFNGISDYDSARADKYPDLDRDVDPASLQ